MLQHTITHKAKISLFAAAALATSLPLLAEPLGAESVGTLKRQSQASESNMAGVDSALEANSPAQTQQSNPTEPAESIGLDSGVQQSAKPHKHNKHKPVQPQHADGSNDQAKLLNEQVVTASGFLRPYMLAPASISAVSPQEIASRPVRDLAEALAHVPGVSIDSSVAKTGGYGISIRGMPSSYTLILMDGKRLNADSSLFPNGFGDSTTSFMPPLSMIERIEVLRGPASTLYGSDAIGGVVNIITKQRFDKWSASLGYDYTFQENKSFGNTQGFNFYTAGPLNSAKNWGLSLRGRQYSRASVPSTDLAKYPTSSGTGTAGRNTIVGLAPFESYNIGGRLLWHDLVSVGSKPRNSAYFDIDYSQQNYDNSQGLLGSYVASGAGSEQDKQAKSGYGAHMDIYRLNAILAHKGHYLDREKSIWQSFDTDTSMQYNITTNPGRYVTTDTMPNKQNPAFGVYAGDSRELASQDIIIDHKSSALFGFTDYLHLNASVGGRYWYNTFRDKLFQAANGSNATKEQHIGALFAEGELAAIDRLFLTLGLRGNFNSIFGANASPRAYLSYNAIKKGWLVFKGGVSTGYKTPALSNLINGVASLTGQGTTHIYGNPNLRPESSVNYEFSILSDNPYFSVSATGFFTNFTDRISSVVGTPQGFTCQSGTCQMYVNVDEAISYGLETSLGIKPISVGYGSISLNGAYTLNFTKVTKGKGLGDPLTNIPLHNFNASLNYDTRHFGLYVRQEYKAGIFRSSVPRGSGQNLGDIVAAFGEYYKPIYLTHLGGYYKPSKHIRINAAIYNLFNVDFVDYQPYTMSGGGTNYANTYNYIREGRRYYVSVQMDF